MPSFDVVSDVDLQEVTNAVDQTHREINTRYDLKGSKSTIEVNKNAIIIMSEEKLKLSAIQDILRQKLSKRGIGLKSVTFNPETKAGGDMLRQEVVVKQGLTTEELKKMNKLVKDMKMKVSSQAQGDQLRVTGKKRDDLQEVMAYLKSEVSNIELQFVNFRD